MPEHNILMISYIYLSWQASDSWIGKDVQEWAPVDKSGKTAFLGWAPGNRGQHHPNPLVQGYFFCPQSQEYYF